MKKKGKRPPPASVKPIRLQWNPQILSFLGESQPPRAAGHFDRFCIVNSMVFTHIDSAVVEVFPLNPLGETRILTAENIAPGEARVVTNGGPDFLTKYVRITLSYGGHQTVFNGQVPQGSPEYVKSMVAGLNEVFFVDQPVVWPFGAIYGHGYNMYPLHETDIS